VAPGRDCLNAGCTVHELKEQKTTKKKVSFPSRPIPFGVSSTGVQVQSCHAETATWMVDDASTKSHSKSDRQP
jgi:hypothetical protein